MIHVDRRKPNDIVLIGEILVDIISTEDGIIKSFGGSPSNITLNLKRMGVDPILCARYGTDGNGELIGHMIAMEGIDTSFLYAIDCPTSVVHINQSVDTPTPEFTRCADYQITLTDALKETIMNAKMIHFSFWTLTEEPLKTAMLDIIRLANEHGVLVGFDPNYHEDLHPGYDLAELIDVMHHVDIMKPSLDDSRRIFQDDASPHELLERYADMGVSLVVMTLGKDGILVRYDDEVVALPSLATDVIDATGAGDAFWSGLYAALLHGESLHDTLMVGLLCSAYNLKVVGSITNLPPYKKLIDLIQKERKA